MKNAFFMFMLVIYGLTATAVVPDSSVCIKYYYSYDSESAKKLKKGEFFYAPEYISVKESQLKKFIDKFSNEDISLTGDIMGRSCANVACLADGKNTLVIVYCNEIAVKYFLRLLKESETQDWLANALLYSSTGRCFPYDKGEYYDNKFIIRWKLLAKANEIKGWMVYDWKWRDEK